MPQNNFEKLDLNRHKRLAKRLGVSERKACKLLQKYIGTSISWSEPPPTQKEFEEMLFRIIESEEARIDNE